MFRYFQLVADLVRGIITKEKDFYMDYHDLCKIVKIIC